MDFAGRHTSRRSCSRLRYCLHFWVRFLKGPAKVREALMSPMTTNVQIWHTRWRKSSIEGCFYLILCCTLFKRGTRGGSCLRHCTSSRKVAGSFSNGVIEDFHWRISSALTLFLGTTQPLTKVSTRGIFWGLKRPSHRVDIPTTFKCRLLQNCRRFSVLEP